MWIVSMGCSRCHFCVDWFWLSGPVFHSMESQSPARTPHDAHVCSDQSDAFPPSAPHEVDMVRPGASESSVTHTLHVGDSGLMH
jgi:hypothetical protein